MTILEQVTALVEKLLKVPADKVTPSSRLVEDLGADSANVMVLIMELEDTFNIMVDDNAVVNFKTVADVVSYIEEHQ
ncbi:MAG: acyl carrier protein [Clostridia bacterium]|nr:acyl carrier protein [Clostridia bacterium]